MEDTRNSIVEKYASCQHRLMHHTPSSVVSVTHVIYAGTSLVLGFLAWPVPSRWHLQRHERE